MGMPRLTGTSEEVTEAVKVALLTPGPVNVMAWTIPRLATWETFWLIVVAVVGKKAEKVLPAALKLTVMGLVASSVTVTVAGLVGSTW